MILTEDVSYIEAWLIPFSHQVLEKFRTIKDDPTNDDIYDLVLLVYYYSKAKKSRMAEEVNHFYY